MTESHYNSRTQKACKQRWKGFSTKKPQNISLVVMWANKYSSATTEIFMGKQLEAPEAAEDTLNHELQEAEEGKYGLNVMSPKAEVKFCSVCL